MATALFRNLWAFLALVVLSLGLYWYLHTAGAALSHSLVLAATPPPSLAEIMEQLRTSEPSEHGERPNLKADIEAAKERISASDYKAAKSNYQRMIEHLEKLEKYRQDPLAFDHQGWLRQAPSAKIREQIIQGRIRHLEQEVQAFYQNIVKIIY